MCRRGDEIGSGLAESTCKRFSSKRMKEAGTRWTMPGTQPTATLHLFVLRGRWGEAISRCRAAA
jgi:hypothetical protein